MFTGIIEASGLIEKMEKNGTNLSFWISSPIAEDLKVDQSLSHDGVCLTVESIQGNLHKVTAISETIDVTNLSLWQVGDAVNLERCLNLNGRLDGHLVQGHVDATGICKKITDKNGSWEYEIDFPSSYAELIIEKGSICLNGISLTVFNITDNQFTVAIIPYTYEHTNMKELLEGDKVNLEFDVIGKYIARRNQLTQL